MFALLNSGRLAVLAALLMANSAGAMSAFAQTFDIHAPEARRGELELENLNAANLGPARGTSEFIRDAHEVKLNYGISDFWKIELGGLIENPTGSGPRLSRVAFENIFVLRAADKAGLALGWFASVEAAADHGTTNAVIFGPIASWKSGSGSASKAWGGSKISELPLGSRNKITG